MQNVSSADQAVEIVHPCMKFLDPGRSLNLAAKFLR
jgi:hypothetical protein